MEADDTREQRRTLLPTQQCSSIQDERIQNLLPNGEDIRFENNTSMTYLSCEEGIPLSEIQSRRTPSIEKMRRSSSNSELRAEHSSHDNDDDSASDEEQVYRKLKRRYRRRGFWYWLRCGGSKGDAPDADTDDDDQGWAERANDEDRLAELRYKKIRLEKRKQNRRSILQMKANLSGQVGNRKPKFSCLRASQFFSDLFTPFDKLRVVKKLLYARGGGGGVAVFNLIKHLFTLNFVIGAIFFGAVYLPNHIKGTETTFGPCNGTDALVGNSTPCSKFIIADCTNESPVTFRGWVENLLDGGCPVASSKLFAGSYPANAGKYPTDKVYFICLIVSYSLSIYALVKALMNWFHLRQKFKFSDCRNTVTTLLFKGWNFRADTAVEGDTEKEFLVQEIQTLKIRQSEFHFDPELSRKRMITHLISALVTLVGLTGVMITMHFIENEFFISAIIAILGKLAHAFFSWLGKWEERPNHDELFWLVVRGLSFQLMSIGVMAFYELILSLKCSASECTCWETHYAQQIYSMVLVIGLDEATIMIILPLLQLIFAKMFERCMKKIDGVGVKVKKLYSCIEPEYQTDAHLFKLIKLQTLSWLSLPVAPLMPLLVCIVLFICFLENISAILGMKLRPKRWFGVARSSSFYATSLLLSWVMCIWPILNVMFQRQPSCNCSPFQNLDRQYRALFAEKNDFILFFFLMVSAMKAMLLMLFFILRPRPVPDGSLKSSMTRNNRRASRNKSKHWYSHTKRFEDTFEATNTLLDMPQ